MTRTIPELMQSAERFALAQEDMAAKSQEDSQHWHHVALAELLREMAFRMDRGTVRGVISPQN